MSHKDESSPHIPSKEAASRLRELAEKDKITTAPLDNFAAVELPSGRVVSSGLPETPEVPAEPSSGSNPAVFQPVEPKRHWGGTVEVRRVVRPSSERIEEAGLASKGSVPSR